MDVCVNNNRKYTRKTYNKFIFKGIICAWRGYPQKPEEDTRFSRAEVQAVMIHPEWGLVLELESSGTVASTLKHCTISPPQQILNMAQL